MNKNLKMILVLVIISMFSAVSLSLTYNFTESKIQERKDAESNRFLFAVFPEAVNFKEITFDPIIKGKVKITNCYKALDENSDPIGLVFISTVMGYSSEIKMMFSYDTNSNTIKSLKILEQHDTPGLGAKIADAKFTNQFTDKNNALDGVDTITGATISSSAIILAVKTTLEEIEPIINDLVR